MRVLQLIQRTQLRGAEVFASQLSQHLLTLGHSVKIVALMDGGAKLPFSGELVVLKRPLSKRFIDVQGWKMLAEVIREFRPDVVQSNAGDTLKFAALSKIWFGWKTPIIFRNANKVSDFVDSLPKLLLNRFFMRQVSHVISVSELCRRDFISTYSFDEKRTTTIPIGIELDQLVERLPPDLNNFFHNHRVLLNVASLVPEKNHTALLNATVALVRVHPDLRLMIIGDGRLRSQIEEQIRGEGLTDKVLMAGYRNDVLSVMANAQVLVLPSLVEGLPAVILEAFYARLPVVANDVGGISEVVKSKETGWLVNKGDEKQLLDAIEAALVHNGETDRLRQNAFDLVSSEFGNGAIANRFAEAYKKIIRHGRKD